MRLFCRTSSHMPYSWFKDGLDASIFAYSAHPYCFYTNLQFSREREMLANRIYSCLVKEVFLNFSSATLYLLFHIIAAHCYFHAFWIQSQRWHLASWLNYQIQYCSLLSISYLEFVCVAVYDMHLLPAAISNYEHSSPPTECWRLLNKLCFNTDIKCAWNI